MQHRARASTMGRRDPRTTTEQDAIEEQELPHPQHGERSDVGGEQRHGAHAGRELDRGGKPVGPIDGERRQRKAEEREQPRQNLRLLTDIGRIDPARIDIVLAIVGLTARADDAAKQYSLGMRQRLGIAAALLPDPKLLVLDEPTNGLDPVGIQEIRALLRQLADEGRTILVSSHLLAELEHVSDWIVVLNEGRVVYQGTVAGLSTGAAELVAEPDDPTDIGVLQRICDEAHVRYRRDGDALVIEAPRSFAGHLNRTAMDQGVVLVELSPRRASREDAFFDLIEAGAR